MVESASGILASHFEIFVTTINFSPDKDTYQCLEMWSHEESEQMHVIKKKNQVNHVIVMVSKYKRHSEYFTMEQGKFIWQEKYIS